MAWSGGGGSGGTGSWAAAGDAAIPNTSSVPQNGHAAGVGVGRRSALQVEQGRMAGLDPDAGKAERELAELEAEVMLDFGKDDD